jgi:short subunit dehydrogenase-like uncharacterized protein
MDFLGRWKGEQWILTLSWEDVSICVEIKFVGRSNDSHIYIYIYGLSVKSVAKFTICSVNDFIAIRTPSMAGLMDTLV